MCRANHTFQLFDSPSPHHRRSIGTHGSAVAQAEKEGRLREPHSETLAKLSTPQGRRTVWWSRYPLQTDEWLLSSHTFRMGLDIRKRKLMKIAICLLRRLWLICIRVELSFLGWLPKISQRGGNFRAFASDLQLLWKRLQYECIGLSQQSLFKKQVNWEHFEERWIYIQKRQLHICSQNNE